MKYRVIVRQTCPKCYKVPVWSDAKHRYVNECVVCHGTGEVSSEICLLTALKDLGVINKEHTAD